MEFTTFVRKPFVVEAVEVTVDNIEELAKMIGKLRYRDGRPYIQVDRRKVPHVYNIYPGFWVTKMEHRLKAYTRKVFMEQFIENGTEISDWVDFINAKTEVKSFNDLRIRP